ELVPPTRTLQLWLHKAGLAPPRVRRIGKKDCQRAQQPHDVWQTDAVERLILLDGSPACWLRISDEYSGAILATELFPPVLLVHGARRRRARGVAPGLRALGPAQGFAGGQRQPVGQHQRFAVGLEPVGGRPGGRYVLERPVPPPAKRRGGEYAW